jgi:hypothetical protein
VFCPRCGQENADDSRFCVECGKRLRGEAGPGAERTAIESKRGGTGRLRALGGRLLGASRRERLVTAGIVAALGVAVAAFFALPTDEDETPADTRDPYVQAADRACVDSKSELGDAQRRSAEVKQTGLNSLRVFAREFDPITARLRSRLASLDPPRRYERKAAQLDARLRQVAAAGRRMARFSAAQDERALIEFARVQRIGGRIETLIAELGLTDCAAIQVTAPR